MTAPPAGFDLAKIFKGVDDPEFGVLKFTPWRIELFDVTNTADRRVWIATRDRTTPRNNKALVVPPSGGS
jgi:hypothetical protein